MGVSKVKYCKCGHEKTLHKNPKSKYTLATYCRQCPCSSYLNRKLPDKASYAFTIFSIIIGMCFLITIWVLTIQSDPALEGRENDTITFTLGQLHEILVLGFLIITLYMFIILIIGPIFEISNMKKRKEFPISDNNGQS
jgi:hypothetical protein